MAHGQDRSSLAQVRSSERPAAGHASTDFLYRAFISYSHEDESSARWLHKALETWRPPRHLIGKHTPVGPVPDTLAPVFRDREELPSSANLNQEVHQALAQSANLIVICSPAAARSRWVNQEVRSFQQLGRSDKVFCLIVRGEPNAGEHPEGGTEECFAPALRKPAEDSGQGGTAEGGPIAADLRPGRDGRSLALMKLISGMLGLRLDELRMREHQRRLRRLSLITALAVLVMLVTSTLAVVALLARHSAEVQQSQAEGLVGFMLKDLDQKMQGSNKLDTLQAISDRAMAYYNALPSRDVDDSVLSGRAEVLLKIGSVQLDQGRLPEALASFQSAERITSRLLTRAPDDPQRMLQEAAMLNWIGKARWYMGQLDAALDNFSDAARFLKQAVERNRGDTGIAYQLAAAHSNMGSILKKRGRLAQANAQYQATLTIFRNLHATNPDNQMWYSEMGWVYTSLGKLAWRRGQLVTGIADYQVDLGIKKAIAAQDPGNRHAQGELAQVHAILGGALLRVGQLDAAAQHLGTAFTIGQAQVEFDPENASARDLLALYSVQLGRLFLLQGKTAQALTQVASAQQILSSLASQNPGNAVYGQHLVSATAERAMIELANDKPREAVLNADKAVDASRSLHAADPDNDDIRLLLANTLLTRGRALDAAGETDKAQDAWREALETMQAMDQASSNPDLLDARASTLLLLGQRTAATAMLVKLDRLGYRDPEFVRLVNQHGLKYPDDFDNHPQEQQPVVTIDHHKGESRDAQQDD